MVEQRRPDTLEPTGFERRGDPGGEVEFWFSSAGSIVGLVSLYHTSEKKTRDRIGL